MGTALGGRRGVQGEVGADREVEPEGPGAAAESEGTEIEGDLVGVVEPGAAAAEPAGTDPELDSVAGLGGPRGVRGELDTGLVAGGGLGAGGADPGVGGLAGELARGDRKGATGEAAGPGAAEDEVDGVIPRRMWSLGKGYGAAGDCVGCGVYGKCVSSKTTCLETMTLRDERSKHL